MPRRRADRGSARSGAPRCRTRRRPPCRRPSARGAAAPRSSVGAPLDAVEQARQRSLVPARPGAHLLEVRERAAVRPAARISAWKARGNTNEPSMARRERDCRIRSPSRRSPARADRSPGRSSTATRRPAADRRDHSAGARRWLPFTKRTCKRPGHALDEVEHAVAARVDAGDQRRPRGERRRRDASSAAGPTRRAPSGCASTGSVAGGGPRRDQIERRAVQPDHQRAARPRHVRHFK